MFKGILLETEIFKRIAGMLSRLHTDFIFKIDKDSLNSGALYTGGGFFYSYKILPNCFKEYSLSENMQIMLPTIDFNKILKFIGADAIFIEITENTMVFKSIDGGSEFEYTLKQLGTTDLVFYDEKDMSFKEQAVDIMVSPSIIEKLLSSLKTFGDVAIKFKWDSNGVNVQSSDEHSLATFSAWFKKEGVKINNIASSGHATYPIHQISDVLSTISDDKVHIVICGSDMPMIIDNIDKSKVSIVGVISPYVSMG